MTATMETVSYELWDAAGGNIVGSVATPEAGLDLAALLLDTDGRDDADDLTLSRRADDGTSHLVATGDPLVAVAAGRRPIATDAAMPAPPP